LEYISLVIQLKRAVKEVPLIAHTQYGMMIMPSSATNSNTPQCEILSVAPLCSSNSIGYSMCREAIKTKPNN
jgi:hypothetical protein